MSAQNDRLHQLAVELPADLAGEVVSFGRYLMGIKDGTSEADLLAIAGTPAQLARFKAAREGRYV